MKAEPLKVVGITREKNKSVIMFNRDFYDGEFVTINLIIMLVSEYEYSRQALERYTHGQGTQHRTN